MTKLGEPVFWKPDCQPVRVHWEPHAEGSAWEYWALSLSCGGCGEYRYLMVEPVMAKNVEMAEKTEQIQLAALHAPPEPDPTDLPPFKGHWGL